MDVVSPNRGTEVGHDEVQAGNAGWLLTEEGESDTSKL